MVNAKNVQSLNDRIEKINNQRVKAETQHEMLTTRLETELGSYKDQFGVDLAGKSFTETRKKINAEIKKVTSEVESEYELKEKVVSAIEAGDIEEAYKLLGLEVKNEEHEEDLAEEPVAEPIIEEDFGGLASDTTVEEPNAIKEEDPILSVEDDFGDFGDLVVEDSSSAEGEVHKATSTIAMSSAKDAIDDLQVEDDGEDELGSDFGFGDLMKGTKFDLGGE